MARGWGIGSKDLDNPSALLFIAINDRKYFTQVSRDLEDELPDGLVGSLQRQYLVPEFKKANYAKGIEDTIDAYINAIENRTSGTIVTTSPTPRGRNTTSRGTAGIPTGCFCLLIIGAFWFYSVLSDHFSAAVAAVDEAEAAVWVRLCRGLSVRRLRTARVVEAVGAAAVRPAVGRRAAAVRIGADSAAAAISAAAARAAVGENFGLRFRSF